MRTTKRILFKRSVTKRFHGRIYPITFHALFIAHINPWKSPEDRYGKTVKNRGNLLVIYNTPPKGIKLSPLSTDL